MLQKGLQESLNFTIKRITGHVRIRIRGPAWQTRAARLASSMAGAEGFSGAGGAAGALPGIVSVDLR